MRITTGAALANCEVHLAASAESALRRLEDLEFDAVVCDLVMPVMTGAELYASLPEDSPLRTRFLFMTGGSLPIAIESFLALVSVPVLRKPFRVAELREAVDALLAS